MGANFEIESQLRGCEYFDVPTPATLDDSQSMLTGNCRFVATPERSYRTFLIYGWEKKIVAQVLCRSPKYLC